MLLEFSVKNFRSIKDKITLNLLASSDKSLDNNLITLKKEKLLRSSVIYGANASGKTNVIIAFSHLTFFVLNSHRFQKGNKLIYQPFKLDKKCLTEPSEFEITFIKNNIKYVYGLAHNEEKVISEYLFYYPDGRKSIIFERKNTKKYKFTVDKKRQEFISENTLDNVLYLANATKLNYEKTSIAFDWFKDNLRVIGPADHPSLMEYTAKLINKDKELKNIILKALIEADIGITDVSAKIDTKQIEFNNLPISIKERIKKEKISEIQKIEEEQITINTVHQVKNKNQEEQQITFKIEDESEGTKRIFSLIGPWIDALLNGRILIADELDTKLHHLLNVFLIKLFHDPTQNKTNAQLIFSTHNTNLLDQDLFRRDQIWFTEKNPENGSTDLYSLSEFKPRKDKNIQKGYLGGRYGALPFIKNQKVI
jgi:AAA15 family ATPase/GTPase